MLNDLIYNFISYDGAQHVDHDRTEIVDKMDLNGGPSYCSPISRQN